MLDQDTDEENEGITPSPEAAPNAQGTQPGSQAAPPYDDTIIGELGAVIDDARLYAAAELAFQKTRAKLLGKNAAIAAGAVIVAIILLHISIIALAVGLVIALEPLVTIWGAIAIVVGVMLVCVGLLGWLALTKGRLIGKMFAGDKTKPAPQEDAA